MNSEDMAIFVNNHESIITGGVEDIEIERMENELGIFLSESYKWFLKTFGQLGILGVMFYGIAKHNIHRSAILTEKYRANGMPSNYLVVCDMDEYVYCLSTTGENCSDCPVFDWSMIDDKIHVKYDSFFRFFFQLMNDAEAK